jgi:hypothetical protein
MPFRVGFMSLLANRTVMPFWVNVPFLLTQPMGFFVWTVPAWLVVTVAFVSLIIDSVTAEAWELEKRPIPSQLRMLRWRDSFGLLLFVSLWGVAWAYLPVSYIVKVAFSLLPHRRLQSNRVSALVVDGDCAVGLERFVVSRGAKNCSLPVAEVEPVALTADHPLFGWIVRLEDKMMEKWDNALVNVQLRWQRRHTVETLRFAFALSLLGFVVAAVALLTPLRVSLPNLLFATPILLCVPTFLTATLALLWYESKHDLSRWGQLRIMEQIVLTRLTAKQIWFGLWFPRFWLAVKIFAIPLVSAWLIALPQLFVLPTKLSLWLLATMAMATFVMPFFFLAAALYFSGTGIAGGESSDPDLSETRIESLRERELLWLMTLALFIKLIHSAFRRTLNPFMLLAFILVLWLVTFSCAIFMLLWAFFTCGMWAG